MKKSYELAMERIIVSKNKKFFAVKEEEEDTVFDEMGKPPDYVSEWKLKEKINTALEEKSNLIENSPSKLIEAENKKDDDSKYNKDTYKMQEPYTISYDISSVLYHGFLNEYGSQGRVGRTIVFELTNKGLIVRANNLSQIVDINSSTMKEISLFENQNILGNFLNIYHGVLPKNIDTEKINILCYDMDSNIYSDDVDMLNLFDEIWVPSRFCKNNLLNLGVRSSIFHIPWGVDASRYREKDVSFQDNLDIDVNDTVFMTIVDYNDDSLLKIFKAYLSGFSSTDNVSLLVCTKYSDDKHNEFIMKQFEKAKVEHENDLPHVMLYNKPICEKNMPLLYNKIDTLVNLSKNNFGLSILENMAVGNSAIVLDNGGHMDFSNDNTTILIKQDDTECSQVSVAMKTIFNKQDKIKKDACKLMAKKYSWTNTVNLIYERILTIKKEK